MFVRIFITILVLAAVPTLGQSGSKNPGKPKPIKATVVVKGDLKPLPDEKKSWTRFESNTDGLSILFPGSQEDWNDDLMGPVKTISVSIATASNMLAIREIGPLVDNRDVEDFLEESIQDAFGSGGARILEKKNVSYEGHFGKQIVLVGQRRRMHARLFVLNGKLFITMVSMNATDYTADFDTWINKFLNSFTVVVPVTEA